MKYAWGILAIFVIGWLAYEVSWHEDHKDVNCLEVHAQSGILCGFIDFATH